MKKELFEELLASVKEGGAVLDGSREPYRAFRARDLDVLAVRERYGLSQSKFAALMGISVGSLRNWEQGRRQPEGSARVLLQVVAHYPEQVLDAVRRVPDPSLRRMVEDTGPAPVRANQVAARQEMFSKWNGWLNIVTDETVQLLMSREVYIEVRNIVASNPTVRTNNRLVAWMTWHYVVGMLMGARRLVDERNDSVSFVRLLFDMQKNCDLLTRAAHVHLYSSDAMEWLAHANFDKLAGKDAPSFPKQDLESDTDRLLDLWPKLEPLANRRIAHIDEASRLGELPKYEDLDNFVDELARLVKKYCLLLEAKDVMLLSAPHYDWKAVFRVPWLPDPGKRRRTRVKDG
jgi:putative transcriptional regulator